MTQSSGRPRLLLVHAHPDDESIGTGATMARYAAQGAEVTLVTCTLGELGEIIPPELAHLAADAGDQLGRYRIGELKAACAALGVTGQRFLGGPGRWRDSGMIGTPENEDPRCFWQADLEVAARQLAAVIRDVRPHVMITYGDNGFYGHPDHIQAHRVAWRGFELAADPSEEIAGPDDGRPLTPWPVAKFYASTTPHRALRDEIALLAGRRDELPPDWTLPRSEADLVYGVPDEHVTTAVDGTAHLAAKRAAMAAHATQISVHGDYFALSNQIAQVVSGVEYYALLAGALRPARDGEREDDLLAGLGLDAAAPVPRDASTGSAG